MVVDVELFGPVFGQEMGERFDLAHQTKVPSRQSEGSHPLSNEERALNWGRNVLGRKIALFSLLGVLSLFFDIVLPSLRWVKVICSYWYLPW